MKMVTTSDLSLDAGNLEHRPIDWLLVPSHLRSPHALTLFKIIFGFLYMRITACMSGCKISHSNAINLHPPIRSKLSYLSDQDGVSLRMDAQPSNQARSNWVERGRAHLPRVAVWPFIRRGFVASCSSGSIYESAMVWAKHRQRRRGSGTLGSGYGHRQPSMRWGFVASRSPTG